MMVEGSNGLIVHKAGFNLIIEYAIFSCFKLQSIDDAPPKPTFEGVIQSVIWLQQVLFWYNVYLVFIGFILFWLIMNKIPSNRLKK